jgi:hypothetical protein
VIDRLQKHGILGPKTITAHECTSMRARSSYWQRLAPGSRTSRVLT